MITIGIDPHKSACQPKPPPAPVKYPDLLGAAGSVEEALRFTSYALKDDHGVSAETRLKAVIIAGEMSEAVARGEGDLVLEVRCSSTYRHKPCRQVLARVWGPRPWHAEARYGRRLRGGATLLRSDAAVAAAQRRPEQPDLRVDGAES